MSTQIYMMCFLLGSLGLLFHLFAVKIPAVKSRAKAANVPFTMGNYFKEDYLAIIASFITIVIAVFLLDEIIGYKPELIKYLKFFFVFIGYTGSSLLIGALGKADGLIKEIVASNPPQEDKLKQ